MYYITHFLDYSIIIKRHRYFKQAASNSRFASIRASVEGTCTVHLIGCVATAFISAGTSLILMEVADCLMFCWTSGCYCRCGVFLSFSFSSPILLNVKRFIYSFRSHRYIAFFSIELVVFYCINCCEYTPLWIHVLVATGQVSRVFLFLLFFFQSLSVSAPPSPSFNYWFKLLCYETALFEFARFFFSVARQSYLKVSKACGYNFFFSKSLYRITRSWLQTVTGVVTLQLSG